jgi:FlaA1/EpsC-like NDP-sugar epimerase
MKHATGSEIFVPKLKSYTVRDLAEAFVSASEEDIQMDVKGSRAGEKDHELLINEHEMKFTREFDSGYVIQAANVVETEAGKSARIGGLSCYSSETADRLGTAELVKLLKQEGLGPKRK